MSEDLILSTLGHTWIFDLDGTLVRHNGYIIDGEDTWITGALDFLRRLPDKDMIIIVTSRRKEQREQTETFLKKSGVRYNAIIFDAPYGERIVVNDRKPSGLATAYAINVKRDKPEIPEVMEDDTL